MREIKDETSRTGRILTSEGGGEVKTRKIAPKHSVSRET